MAGFSRYAGAHGMRLQVVENVQDAKTVRELVKFWQPDGIAVEGGVDERGIFTPKLFGRTPTVFLVCDPHRLGQSALRVNHDSESLAFLAARELLSSGLKSFAYFGFEKLFWSDDRYRSFAAALKLNGFGCNVFTRRFAPARNREGRRLERIVAWLKALPKPCGLLAANDMLACEAIDLCREAGIAVPDEIAILGIDNDEVACENCQPTLSSIKPNFGEAGCICAELLDMAMAGKLAGVERQRYFPAAGVVHRASTRRECAFSPAIARARELIRLKACDGLKPRDVFAAMKCSRRLAEMRFRKALGHTVQSEIVDVRIAKAKELLAAAQVPIEAIAGRCGWKSTARLRTVFRAREGMSLREWRDRHSWFARKREDG